MLCGVESAAYRVQCSGCSISAVDTCMALAKNRREEIILKLEAVLDK